MSIGQLPRLALQTLGGIREWSDQFAHRLEYLFASPRQIGLAEIIQFQSTADSPGYLSIPSPQGDIILQWGSGTITSPATSQAVAFPVEFPSNAWVAFVIGAGVNKFAYSVNALATTGFTAEAANGGTTDNFYWLAAGN